MYKVFFLLDINVYKKVDLFILFKKIEKIFEILRIKTQLWCIFFWI